MVKILNIKDHKNKFFDILDQTDKSQVGVMTLEAYQQSGGGESHSGDQIVYIIEGKGQIKLDSEVFDVKEGDCLIIKAGTVHQIINNSKQKLFLISVYTPPVY